MKVLKIAWKDLTRALRTASALVFMFGVPLLIGCMFYFMFGSMAGKDKTTITLPATKVVVANLDQGSPQLPAGLGADSMGALVVRALQGKDLANLVEISSAADAVSARAQVDQREAGVALIIPANFSAAYLEPQGKSAVEFYQDPTLSIGPGVVRSLVSGVLDGFSGTKIAAEVTSISGGDAAAAGAAAQRYAMAVQTNGAKSLVRVREPESANKAQPPSFLAQIVGPILGGMMIFFAFFTGGSTAQSIVREQEEGTLARLFSTPTRQSTILAGKFLAVGLTVTVQVSILLVVSHLLFGISWGTLGAVALNAAGTILAASAFGILITSLLKTMRQGGIIYGGLVTATGMLGMMGIFSGSLPGGASAGSWAPLFVPQGWAVRGLQMAMNGAPTSDIALNALALLAWALVLFTIGTLRFQKRFA